MSDVFSLERTALRLEKVVLVCQTAQWSPGNVRAVAGFPQLSGAAAGCTCGVNWWHFGVSLVLISVFSQIAGVL